MVTPIRPNRGGFLRPFGCGWFIREFLLGHGPEGSPVIDPDRGACQQDIFYNYKLALYRAYAEDAVARDEEERIRRGLPPYTPEEAEVRFRYHFERIAYKLTRCRYHSFRRYFHWLKQLGWVEPTGEEEDSAMQEATDYHPDAYPRIYYRLTKEGIEAPEEDWAHPQRLTLPEIAGEPIEDYLRGKRRERKYRRPRKYERYIRPYTAGMFIRDYLLGLGPEGTPTIDPDEGDYTEHIFHHYKEMLRRAYAKDAVAREDEERKKRGEKPYTEQEYAERMEWHLTRIPYKLHAARSVSFFRYFNYLKQLGFVEPTGKEETSIVQLNYPDAPPRRYYRVSAKGKAAPEVDWFRPQLVLYPHFSPDYFVTRNRERRQRIKQGYR